MGDRVQGPPVEPEPRAENVPIYRPAETQGRVWQGEILGRVIQIKPTIESIEAGDEGGLEANPVVHELAIVMSQDCDLEQDYKRRGDHRPGTLPNVLLCDVYLAEALRARVRENDQLGSTDWKKRIAQNQNERFHYLEKVGPECDLQGEGLSALALDFKIYFTLPTDELYARLPRGIQRRCRLNSPYVEHLAYRFFKFQSRIALPRDHEIEPIRD